MHRAGILPPAIRITGRNGRDRAMRSAVGGTWRVARRQVPAGGRIFCRGWCRSWKTTSSTVSTTAGGMFPTETSASRSPPRTKWPCFENARVRRRVTDLLYLDLFGGQAARRHLQDARIAQRASHQRALQGLDYLWVGERRECRRPAEGDEEPHAVRRSLHPGDGSQGRGESEHFLHSIPYMQFPLCKAGGL